MRLAARKDDNHNEISNAFERLGWSVLDIHQIPNCADILIGKWKCSIIIEIKDGLKPPSKQKLTHGEMAFKDRWKGDYRIVTCIKDVINIDREYMKSIE